MSENFELFFPSQKFAFRAKYPMTTLKSGPLFTGTPELTKDSFFGQIIIVSFTEELDRDSPTSIFYLVENGPGSMVR